MKTKAVRLYGENDLRLEEFELPELKDGEILIKIIYYMFITLERFFQIFRFICC